MTIEDVSRVLVLLKRKLIILVLVMTAGFIGAFPFTSDVIKTIRTDILPEGAALIYLTPAEVMLLRVKISLIAGALITFPFIFYYAYLAIRSRFGYRISIPKFSVLFLIIFAIILFLAGTAYSYYLMLPFFIDYLFYNAAAAGVTATYSVAEFISFVAMATLVFGLVFEFPLFIVVLVRTGMVERRTLANYRRYVYVGLLTVAAIVTPPDVLSQIIVAVPLIIFYEVSLLFLKLTGYK